MKYLVILAFLSVSTLSFATGSDSTKAVASLPSVSLKNTDGQSIDLKSYGTNGKITIISFWATWCKPCIKELRNMQDLMDDWAEEYNAELVAISVDDSRNSSKVKPFAAGQGWTFDILLDPNGEAQRAMNVTNPPVTYLIDTAGNVVYTHTGYLEGDEYDLEEEIKKLTGTADSSKKDKKK
ncbi:MAG: TlpA family protein disulfide reductase [Flavobacteriales bacterium]|nr:TlpA family protein disulfide reductase [Bacteroidota bacterium]MCB9239492.1 TlpA family protein disulfide reductase [Flavobacteriales bacterium]